MAGDIVISKETSWSASNLTLSAVSELIRRRFCPACQKYIEPIFSDLDTGFQFIWLDEVEPEGFNCFAKAARIAFEQFKNAGPEKDWAADYYSGMLAIWSDLLNKLEKDPRFRPN